VSARRIIPLLALALLALTGCGQERQDADEPEGSFRLEVVDASFPESQSIAERTALRIRVRNPGEETVPNVAATVETQPPQGGAAPVAFGQRQNDPRLADPNRPVWILDREPRGGTSAYANSWSLGPLKAGETKTFEWQLTAVQSGDYTVDYRLAPGLDGKARLAEGSRASGTFDVTIADEPIPARVNDAGEVVRGEEAGAGAD
jgi:hypothetical protein